MSQKPVVVIGAGLAGLSAALYLQKFGRSVVVVESSSRPGGRVATDNVDGFLCDHGFQLINTKYPEIKALNALEGVEYVLAPRAVEVCLLDSIVELGDPRSSLGGLFSQTLGSWKEKTSFLAYLAKRPQEKRSIGYEMKLAGVGSLYEKVLRPFLTGVFFADPELIDAKTGRDLIQHFIVGAPAIPRAGAGEFSRTLAAQVKDLRFGVKVEKLEGLRVLTSEGEIDSSGIIVATDLSEAGRLIERDCGFQWNSSITWFFAADRAPTSSQKIRIDGLPRGPIVNTMVLSNLVSELAPSGRSLIQATTLSGADEESVRRHLELLWKTSVSEWRLLKRYEIPRALPAFTPGRTPIEQKIREGLFIAGDYCTEPSQNGALLAGRLAAQELAFN